MTTVCCRTRLCDRYSAVLNVGCILDCRLHVPLKVPCIATAEATDQIKRDREIDRSVQLSCGEHTVSMLM